MRLAGDEEDFTVQAVGNGREALDAVAAESPHIAVLDVRMPGMDGVVCTEELRKRYPRLLIFILTTFDDAAAWYKRAWKRAPTCIC